MPCLLATCFPPGGRGGPPPPALEDGPGVNDDSDDDFAVMPAPLVPPPRGHHRDDRSESEAEDEFVFDDDRDSDGDSSSSSSDDSVHIDDAGDDDDGVPDVDVVVRDVGPGGVHTWEEAINYAGLLEKDGKLCINDGGIAGQALGRFSCVHRCRSLPRREPLSVTRSHTYLPLH